MTSMDSRRSLSSGRRRNAGALNPQLARPMLAYGDGEARPRRKPMSACDSYSGLSAESAPKSRSPVTPRLGQPANRPVDPRGIRRAPVREAAVPASPHRRGRELRHRKRGLAASGQLTALSQSSWSVLSRQQSRGSDHPGYRMLLRTKRTRPSRVQRRRQARADAFLPRDRAGRDDIHRGFSDGSRHKD